MFTLGNECSGAAFSPCRTWRYQLWRRWNDAPLLILMGLNPSKADESHNDPTGRKQRIGDAWLKEKRVKDNRSCTRTKKLS
ncbi:DUF1643 domain-containing protein [Acaryochloris marina]|uniref:DUF1643 domain-containing protein n=1 Tax=Acaryochloris marina TaxID=155978 RepID=UPI001BB0C663|nr:DUF1643 domain-containing protein [Acaryochloris marina]QUY40546.1 DUF1643 domain-containing protein [Acaryochloris marina S15]